MLSLSLLALIAAGGINAASPQAPRDQFFSALGSLCGQAFEGRVVSPPVEADQAFAGQRLVMHVAQCGEEEIRIPFRVGEDRSRTWVIRREDGALALSHDHRHEDGSEDPVSRYGGASVAEGSSARQEFPADRFSRDLFEREGLAASMTNVWAMEVHPGQMFAYELRRPGRFFRVEFDLTRPIPPGTAGTD